MLTPKEKKTRRRKMARRMARVRTREAMMGQTTTMGEMTTRVRRVEVSFHKRAFVDGALRLRASYKRRTISHHPKIATCPL